MQSSDVSRQLAVFDRERIERVMHEVASFRAGGAVEKIASLLCEDIRLEFAGNLPGFPFLGEYHGREAALFMLNRMRTEIEYVSFDILAAIIELDSAFMRRRAVLRHRGTGKSGAVEIWDTYRFRDGMVSELVLFPDLAALRQLG